MANVMVESKIVTGGRLQSTLDPVILEFLEEEITVADLIRRTVAEQVRVLQARSRLAAEGDEQARALLAQQYGDAGTQSDGRIDIGREVQRAQQAFRRGHYQVLVNGRPATGLEETLTFGTDTTIRFVRLTPLVGG